jgi:hypothetical protein
MKNTGFAVAAEFENTMQFLIPNLQKLVGNLPRIKTFSRTEIIKNLSDYYKSERLVLVLGAGVSMGFGLPNWNTLLQKLIITTIEKEGNVSSLLSKLFTNIFSPSPLIAGRYLQKFYEDKKLSFEEAVQRVLYEEADLDKKSELMEEIINFCVAPGKSPNLDSIISYNFDDILEQRLANVGIPVPFKPIYGVGINPDGQLPIYHVHGFLPQQGNLDEQNKITFGESVYHKQYYDIYSWNNIVQINKFRDANCLFIGTSLTDPNIRRLLDIAKTQKGEKAAPHFIFKIKYNEEIIKKRLELLLKENKKLMDEKSIAAMDFNETVGFLIEIIERYEETDTASFGVKTIWINDWDEIPEMMREIRETAIA